MRPPKKVRDKLQNYFDFFVKTDKNRNDFNHFFKIYQTIWLVFCSRKKGEKKEEAAAPAEEGDKKEEEACEKKEEVLDFFFNAAFDQNSFQNPKFCSKFYQNPNNFSSSPKILINLY